MYVEASSPAVPGQKARLCSKSFSGPAQKKFTFKYHPYVVATTQLSVLLENSNGVVNLWNATEKGRNAWLTGTIDINSNSSFRV